MDRENRLPARSADPLRQRAERLWPAAWAIARRRCHHTLYRLRLGEGGFYDADDFAQDVFLEFWSLLQRPELAGLTFADSALRTAWSKALWGGGLRILRRAPQRLWRRPEFLVEPARLDPTGGCERAADSGAAALPAALLAGSDGHQVQAQLEQLADLQAALGQLRPSQRQVLYMTAVQQLPARLVAQRLRLSSANAVHQRVRSARVQLARREQAHG